MRFFDFLKDKINPKSNNKDKSIEHALLALAYFQKAKRENPKEIGFTVCVEGKNSFVEIK